MRALVQRVSSASVVVGGEIVGRIDDGLCAFVGVTHHDGEAEALRLAEKLWNLRILDDDQGQMGRSVALGSGAVLVVSQFTLYGDTTKGRRPTWIDAARPEQAAPLVDRVVSALEELGATVATGRFGADMSVQLVNDGPVTVMLEV